MYNGHYKKQKCPTTPIKKKTVETCNKCFVLEDTFIPKTLDIKSQKKQCYLKEKTSNSNNGKLFKGPTEGNNSKK